MLKGSGRQLEGPTRNLEYTDLYQGYGWHLSISLRLNINFAGLFKGLADVLFNALRGAAGPAKPIYSN